MRNAKVVHAKNHRVLQKIESVVQKEKDHVYRTKNTIPEKKRMHMAAVLQNRLADSIDLLIQVRQAHWNVKGPSFMALHELFDKVAEATEEYSDLIAERIAQFGFIAQGTITVIAGRTALPEYPLNITTGKQHIEVLSYALATYGELILMSINQASELNDPATADLLTQISRSVDKHLWFIEAHHQTEE